MRLVLVIVFPLVAACASNFAAEVESADAGCAAKPDLVEQARCYRLAEEPVWQKDAPATLLDFQAWSARRIDLAVALEGGQISIAQYTDQMAAAEKTLAEAQARVYGPKTAPAGTSPFPLSLLDALASARAARARADADAALTRSLAPKGNPYPTIGNTTCRRNPDVPSQVECSAKNP